jgi:hypothetical protein
MASGTPQDRRWLTPKSPRHAPRSPTSPPEDDQPCDRCQPPPDNRHRLAGGTGSAMTQDGMPRPHGVEEPRPPGQPPCRSAPAPPRCQRTRRRAKGPAPDATGKPLDLSGLWHLNPTNQP